MRALIVMVGLLTCASCARNPPPEAPFTSNHVEGSFALLDLVDGSLVNVGDIESGHLPCSTFKIPNTLIGLDTGVIDGEDFALPWDGKQRSIDAWNRDHNLRTAIQFSVVWFYQEVARRIGHERMKTHVAAFEYGNHDIGASDAVDTFWLTGPLRISPHQQVDFLAKLRARKLPLKNEYMKLVERILPREESNGFVMHAKTGLGTEDGRTVGWLVGFVDHGKQAWAFATLVRGPKEEESRLAKVRHPIAKALLARYGAWRSDGSGG